jgi:arylsulfatase A-like enzyme
MKQTRLHKLVILFVLVVVFVSANFSRSTAQSQKPNVILILADDISYGSLTCNGGNLYSTPNLDSMAQRGMRFTQCHATPYCSPSRFQFLTGKYNFRNYVNWGDMDTAQRTIGNLMRDAGYKTGCYGKWQFGGGDVSVHALGFDDYCLYNAFDGGEKGDRYKSPTIYTNGDFVSSKRTENKYSEDIFTDSVINFIDRNKSVPFFIYYPMALVHGPFQPTPDDTAFVNWNPEESNESFYPSMVAYMDKKIGEIIAHLKEIGLDKNTVVMYSGDNGSSKSVGIYREGDSTVYGGKSITTEAGTRVPLIVLWDGKIVPGTVNNDLIDFTDFLPTVANIAHIPVPAPYGPIDGVSFAPRLTGNAGTPRDWIFYHYDPHPGYNTYKRWAQNATYKLYDTSSYNSQRLFYNIATDPGEKFPVPDSLLSIDEAQWKENFLSVFNNHIQQGFALFETPVAFTTTDSSTLVHDTIDIDGGSGITARGVVWSEDHNPTLSGGNYTFDGTGNGIFGTKIPGLKSNTTYYVRTYATNVAGTAYSKETSFTTARAFPVATAATSISENSFTANWDELAWRDRLHA